MEVHAVRSSGSVSPVFCEALPRGKLSRNAAISADCSGLGFVP